jgi:hypothetical protein
MYSEHEFDDISICSDVISQLKIENESSYGGIYSNNNDDQSLTDYSEINSNKKKPKKKKNDTKPVIFEWEEEEKDTVYLTGSFCNWKQFFIMPKKNNIYSLTIQLPKAKHLFKFRINDIFYINKKYPIIKEDGNNINYIDTTDTLNTPSKKNISKKQSGSLGNITESEKDEKNSENSDSSSNSYSDDLEEDEEENIIFKKRRKRIKKMKKIKYSQIYPKKINLNNYAPDVPYSYNYMYNIDVISKQRLIGKRKYYEPKENNLLGDNCSYKKIGVLPAVEINHIHSNETIISGERVLCSSFMRYRNKFITFLYYKPKE